MKITNIKTITNQMPLSKTFRVSNFFMTQRCTCITRIYTDEVIIGECYNGDEYETQAEVIKIIHEEIKPKVIGMEIASTEKIWEAMLGPTYNILRDRKLATNAQACIDSAVLDAWGKSLNQPLFKSWGGYKTELPGVAIAGDYEEWKKLADLGTEMENPRAADLGGSNHNT